MLAGVTGILFLTIFPQFLFPLPLKNYYLLNSKPKSGTCFASHLNSSFQGLIITHIRFFFLNAQTHSINCNLNSGRGKCIVFCVQADMARVPQVFKHYFNISSLSTNISKHFTLTFLNIFDYFRSVFFKLNINQESTPRPVLNVLAA